MPSPYKEIPITFEKGLVTEIEESLLDIGQASELLNWEPAANGALRVRNAYTPITKTGLTSPYNVRGFGAIASGTAVAGAVTSPRLVQSEVWPNGDADAVATKTLTLNGVSIGDTLVAVVSEDSETSPTVTAGWTQRAVAGTAAENHVKFYTKVAGSSTEPFTYTVSLARIRSVTLYEFKYMDAEDPGTKWAANSKFSGSGGSDTLSVSAVDTDGGIGIVGYSYNGGTPDTTDSGTAGWSTPSQDNANTRVGVAFSDLDQLDGSIVTNPAANAFSYTTASWTPPATGMVIVLIGIANQLSADIFSTLTVSGNGLTWHDCLDAGELGGSSDASSFGLQGYAWADCSLVAPTPGAITVSGTTSGNNHGVFCSFIFAAGADLIDPFVQKVSNDYLLSGTPVGPNLSTLQSSSGILGGAMQFDDGAESPPIPTIGAGNWEAQADVFSLDVSPPEAGSNEFHFTTAWGSSSSSPDTTATWTEVAGPNDQALLVHYEIASAGSGAKAYHGDLTGAGTAIEGFDYIANRRITAKMVVWGFTPPDVSADTVDFFIVMAVATGSTAYKVYQIPRDEITSGTWEQIDSVTDALQNDSLVAFAQGAGNLLWSSSSMIYPRAIELATLSASNVTDLLGLAGRTLAYHKDRMFVAGSQQNPSRVYFSDIGLPTDFTTAIDFLDIGGDDGEAIQDLNSVEGLLLIPKTNRAYLVSGSGVESFFVNELAGGTAAPGRSAIRTPYGTMLAGEDDVWVVQGGGVDPMSRPLGDGYVITGSVSSAYAQDSAIVCDSVTGTVWRVNLVTGAWSIEEVAGASGDADVFIVFSLNGRIYYGTNGSTTQVGGTRTLSSDRTYDATSGGMRLIGATGKIALLGPSVKYTARYLYMQLRNHDLAHENVLGIDIVSDQGTEHHAVTVSQEVQRESISLGKHKGAEWLKIALSAESSAIAGAIDVERTVLGVNTEAPRTHDRV